tara:strand:+ start:5556 stop:5732 length:177 start_codon:yes stop_codon:yes gene_type:complete
VGNCPLIKMEKKMIKMESPNRKGQFKMFQPEDVDAAKKQGWVEVGAKPKAKKKASKKK